jgi:hypothetical protein
LKIITRIRISALVAIVLYFGISISLHFYRQEKVRQEYYAKGIYEIEGTYAYYDGFNSFGGYYMICEPPTEKDALKELVLNYIQEHDIINDLLNRSPEINVDAVELSFFKPSIGFPVGWKYIHDGKFSFLALEFDRNLIIRIYIPKKAQSQNEYEIFIVGD